MLRKDLAAKWNEAIANPLLQDLPFKFEMNQWGTLEMSPASNLHSIVQSSVYDELRKRRGGRAVIEFSVQTSNGVRVADVVWMSASRFKAHGSQTPASIAPEICVEIMSPSNSWAEMHMKAALYLEAGATEVWIQPIEGKRLVIRPE
jgi:Uma2 family endonuclease